jgi:hypothetical protein
VVNILFFYCGHITYIHSICLFVAFYNDMKNIINERANIFIRLEIFVAAIIGLVYILMFTKNGGVGISSDSIEYVTAALNFKSEGNLYNVSNKPLVDFPALYPLVLAGISWIFHVTPYKAGHIVNALMFMLVIYVSGLVMLKLTDQRSPRLVTLLSICIGFPLLCIYMMLWSETLFILLVSLFLLQSNRYLKNSSLRILMVLSLISGLASITRFAGVTVIGTGLCIIIFNKNLTTKWKTIHVLIFSFLSCAFLIGNLTRNFLLTSTEIGFRESSITPLTKNIELYGQVMYAWLMIPFNLRFFPCVISGVTLTIFTCVLCYKLLYKKEEMTVFLTCCTFFIIYSFFMIISASISRYQALDGRLLSPLFIPLIFIVVILLIRLINKQQKKYRNFYGGVFVAVVLTFNFYQYTIAEEWRAFVNHNGVSGFTNVYWRNSAIAKYLRANPNYFKKRIPVYSNNNELTYFYSGNSSELLPHKLSKSQQLEFEKSKFVYVVWYNVFEEKELITYNELTTSKKIIHQFDTDDGKILLLERK